MNLKTLTFVLITINAMATTVNFKNIEGSTGSFIDGVLNVPITTNVAEVMGLKITVRSGDVNHELNAVADGFGINDLLDTNINERIRFNEEEKLILSFDKDIIITQFDFQFFDYGEHFYIEHSTGVLDITWDDLSHKNSDYIHTNLVVSAHSDIGFFVTGNDNIGLQSLDIDVLGNVNLPLLTLTHSNNILYLSAQVTNPSETLYFLNSSHLLESNTWETINSFSTSTNWVFPSTNEMHFFRVTP